MVGSHPMFMVVVMMVVGMVMTCGYVYMGVAMLYAVGEALYKHLDKEAG